MERRRRRHASRHRVRTAGRRRADPRAANGITIVSSLARGIDGIAHRAALEADGRTVAGLANGLDTVYPSEHAGLSEEIAERGALINDYPLGTKPLSEYFPHRNRIMSGMARRPSRGPRTYSKRSA